MKIKEQNRTILIVCKEYHEYCKKTLTKQTKETFSITNPKFIACTIKVEWNCKWKRLASRVLINFIFSRCFRIMGAGNASRDKYLIHNKWKIF